MQIALSDAGLTSEDIDMLVAHATATPLGDAAEIKAINQVHGARANPLPVTSIKGHIGHTGASTGAMGVISAILAMHSSQIPHTAGTTDPEPDALFRVVTTSPLKADIATAQINAFGFGGQNASVVIERA